MLWPPAKDVVEDCPVQPHLVTKHWNIERPTRPSNPLACQESFGVVCVWPGCVDQGGQVDFVYIGAEDVYSWAHGACPDLVLADPREIIWLQNIVDGIRRCKIHP